MYWQIVETTLEVWFRQSICLPFIAPIGLLKVCDGWREQTFQILPVAHVLLDSQSALLRRLLFKPRDFVQTRWSFLIFFFKGAVFAKNYSELIALFYAADFELELVFDGLAPRDDESDRADVKPRGLTEQAEIRMQLRAAVVLSCCL